MLSLTSRDLCDSLAHPLGGQRDLLLVAARYAVRGDVHIMAEIEKVQGGLQHSNIRLQRLV